MVRRGRRCKHLLDNLKKMREHWKLKEETPDRTLLRTPFERNYGPVTRQTMILIVLLYKFVTFPKQ
jgi:hypothetical protein